MPGVGQQIRRTRLARGLTQQGLARAAGMAQGDVSLIERGLTNPTVRTVERLVEVIGTTTIRVSARQGAVPTRVPGVLHPVTHDEAPAVEWLVEGFLSRGAVTMLAGAPGAGKSLLAQSIATAAVSGNTNVVGIGVEPARVCIVDGENGDDLIQRRFAALGLEAAAWGTRLRVFQAEGFDLVSDLEQLDASEAVPGRAAHAVPHPPAGDGADPPHHQGHDHLPGLRCHRQHHRGGVHAHAQQLCDGACAGV